ncbi:MAG: DoxX family protein [Bacteroidota bacterium]
MNQAHNNTSQYSQGKPRRRKTNIVLWILQALLAAAYLMAGYQKALLPLDVASVTITWIPDVPPPLVRFIGISELLGALGLILPRVTGIGRQLTTLAAAGLAVVMASATVFHIARGEFFVLPMTLTFFVLLAFVAYGRWKLAPFASKGNAG